MEVQPRTTSARCVLGWWWVFTILITATYTATLTSVLTVDLRASNVDSIDDLALSSLAPLVLTDSVWETFFKVFILLLIIVVVVVIDLIVVVITLISIIIIVVVVIVVVVFIIIVFRVIWLFDLWTPPNWLWLSGVLLFSLPL